MKLKIDINSFLRKLFFISIIFWLLFACKQNQQINEQKEITITIKSDTNIKLKEPSFLKTAKGMEWKNVKSFAISKIEEITEGYEIKAWHIEGKELKANYKFEKDSIIFASSKSKTLLSYKVEHWKENIDCQTYTLDEQEELYGVAWATTEAKTKIYEGFKAKEFEQQEINADGSTVIKIYKEMERKY
ncbi:MAG: hypothetical protein ACTTKH_04840 [Treponema sp.]